MFPPSGTDAQAHKANLIFVLAGLEARKMYGLKVFREGIAPRLLLSVGRFEIRKLSRLDLTVPVNLLEIAARVPPPLRHFFVLFDEEGASVERVRLGRFGTWTEIQALAEWLGRRKEVGSVFIISSLSHIPRIDISCRALLPERIRYKFLPVPESKLSGKEERECVVRKAFQSEVWKTLLYHVLIAFHKLSIRFRYR
jgi:hypothetical protein